MANLKERLLGLIDNGTSAALSLVDKMNETINSIDWDEQFESLNTVKDSLLQKGNELLGEFNELMKQVKNNISDFEVTVPFDESLGEKFDSRIEDGNLIVEVTFKDEHTERSNKTAVTIPQNCDVEKKTEKYNAVTKTMTVIIPKVINEPKEETKEEAKTEKKKSTRYKVSRVAATKKEAKEETTSHAQEAASKLLKKFRENSAKAATKVVQQSRATNGRFVKRTPSETKR